MELVKTGVPGFDEIVIGGIQKNRCVLLSGVPGTGKTIFGFQFICGGTEQGENGLFISCEENKERIIAYASGLCENFMNHKGKVTILHYPLTGKMFTFGEILDLIKKNNIKRVVLDSLSVFSYMIGDKVTYRKEIADFISKIKEHNVTLLVTSEKSFEHLDNVVYHIEDFLFDGVILFSKIRKGSSYERCITVAKLRGQKHLLGIYPFTISEKGIEVFPQELPFSLIERDEAK